MLTKKITTDRPVTRIRSYRNGKVCYLKGCEGASRYSNILHRVVGTPRRFLRPVSRCSIRLHGALHSPIQSHRWLMYGLSVSPIALAHESLQRGQSRREAPFKRRILGLFMPGLGLGLGLGPGL